MTERRTRNAWEELSRRLLADTDAGATKGTGKRLGDGKRTARDRHVLSRVNGGSVLLAATSNVVLLLAVLVTGATTVGLVAFGAVGVISWLLVVAEILSVRRL